MRLQFWLAFALLLTLCSAEIFFQEEFGSGWEKRWVISKHKEKEGTAGDFVISAGKYFADAEADKGLKTAKDARFYQISAQIKEFNNKNRDLIIQYSVKHEQNIDCGGGYIKLLPAGIDQDGFNGDSPYNIMFGPDICGMTKRVHAILTHKDKNHLVKSDIRAEGDEWTHLYTFILHSNQTFNVLIDNNSVRKGSITENWDILPPKEILDPSVSKPADWVDEKDIDDPAAAKPEGWDDIPKQIPDKNAKRPEDWDTELDGEWEAPLIDNPEFKGEWKPKKIPNPAYKGAWVHPKIPNPDYSEDNTIGKYDSHKYVGFEIWQVKAGTIFDNVLVTDSIETAKQWAEKTTKTQEGEKAAKKKEQDAKAEEAKSGGDSDDTGMPDLSDFDDIPDESELDEEDEDHDEL